MLGNTDDGLPCGKGRLGRPAFHPPMSGPVRIG